MGKRGACSKLPMKARNLQLSEPRINVDAGSYALTFNFANEIADFLAFSAKMSPIFAKLVQ